MFQLVPEYARASHTWTEIGGGCLVLCGCKDKLLGREVLWGSPPQRWGGWAR